MSEIEPNVNEAGAVDIGSAAAVEEAVAVPVPAGEHLGTGRRKSSVARVRIRPGAGQVVINGKPYDQFFCAPRDRADVLAPLSVTSTLGKWDVHVNVIGGGTTGQAGAIKLGLSRALVGSFKSHEVKLREAGFLTRDAREVERKKYGQRKARRRFQFSKR